MRLVGNSVGIVLLIAAVCCGPTVAQDQKSPAGRLVRDHYPGYHLLRLDERDADTRVSLLKHFKNSDCDVIRADFDGDGHPDYGMLLKSDTSAAAKVVVLLCDAQQRCHGVYELDITGYSEGAYLSALPVGSKIAEAGAVEGGKDLPPLKLTTVGIQIVYFEKGKVALYWDKKVKRIVEVGTSD